jgi:hypothetical protein
VEKLCAVLGVATGEGSPLGDIDAKEQELRRDRRIILLLADWLLVEKREACQRSTRDDNKLYAETRLFCEAKNRIA